jgi:ribosomal protein S18 acetylase RimI-like enzyme
MPDSLHDLDITEATEVDVASVIALWQAAGLTRPWNDPTRDIAFAMQSPNSTILIGKKNGALLASAMVGHDGHRGTVYYLGVPPDAQGSGLGRVMMHAVERWLRDQGVWKLNLMVREDNDAVAGFYDALGYQREPRLVFAKDLEDRKANAQSSPNSDS